MALDRRQLAAVAEAQGARKRSAEVAAHRFEALGEGRYQLTDPSAGVTLELDFLRREGHQLKGELLVRCELPGALTFDGILSVGDFNVSSSRVREGHAKYLQARSKAKDVDWTGLLEEFCQRVLAAERNGSPAVLLADLPRPNPDEALDVMGLRLLDRHPAILFGDGGTAKSYLGLWFAGLLSERGRRVAMFDWELSGEDHRDRLERLFGADGMPDIHYARCARPLVHEAERLRRIVRENAIDFAVFDSIAPACDGPPEAAEIASRYFQALRQLGELGSLHVAHVTKSGDNADRRPFGSAFWHNLARGTWNARLAEASPDDAALHVALHNRKANLGPLRPSVGFELAFTDNSTTIRRVDLGDVPDLAAGLSVRQRMALALRRGAMSPEALADEVEAKVETINRTARRYKNQFTILDGGRLSLLERRS